MRHSTKAASGRGSVKVFTGYFGYTVNVSKDKPTNAEVKAMIAEKLRTANKSLIFAGIIRENG